MKKVFISLFIGMVILALVIQTSNIHDLSLKIIAASPILVCGSFVIVVCSSILRSVRWRIIVGKGRFLNFFSILQVGNLLSNILPAHLQEPVKAAILQRKENIVFGHGLSSIFLERLTDVVGLLSIGIMASILFPTVGNVQLWMFQLIKDIIIFASLLTGFLIFFVLKPKLFSKIFSPFKKHRYLEKLYEKLEFLILELSEGFKGMGKKSLNMMAALLITVLSWMINFVAVYILFVSVGFQISPLIVLFGFVSAALGMALPQPPGYVGTLEAIWLGAFSTLGYAQNSEILAVGILYHLIILVYTTVLGIIGMIVMRLSIKDILFNYRKKS
jgi:uncharacterized protein (TIRG00374 family)